MDALGDNPASERGRRLDLQDARRRVLLIEDRLELRALHGPVGDQPLERVQVLARRHVGAVGVLELG